MFCLTAGTDNANGNSNNIIFTIKDAKLYVPVITLSAKGNQKLSKRFCKGSKDQFIGMNIKQKARIKIWQMNIGIFSNQIFLGSMYHLFQFIQTKMTILKNVHIEHITYQKELLIIITSSPMEKLLW